MSSWICSTVELQMLKITYVRPILANSLLYVRPSSVSYKSLAFQLCQPKDFCPSRAEGKPFGRLASVPLALYACQCACLAAVAIRGFIVLYW